MKRRVARDHQEIVQALREMMAEMIDERALTLAEVIGQDGGKPRVVDDGEEVGYEVGHARARGVRYQAGDRVVIGRTKSGERFILGSLTTAEGRAGAAVGGEEIIDDQIEKRHLKRNSVDGEIVATDSIDRAHVKRNAIGADQLAGGSVDRVHLRQNSVGNTQLDSNSVDRAQLRPNSVGRDQIDNGAVGPQELQENYALDNHDHDGQYAADNHNHDDRYAKKDDIPDKPDDKDILGAKFDGKSIATWIKSFDARLKKLE